MRRDEAELEASRRNRDDPEAARFEFYAFDQSAGMSDDAWDVATRLRPGGAAAPGTYAGARRARPRATAVDEPVAAPPPPRARRRAPDLSAIGRWLVRRRAARAGEDEEADPERAGVFVRSLGAAVIVMGMVWMGMLIALAAILKPNDAKSVGFYLGAAVLGLLAILLGVAIRRS
jgi:hypothetical protein